MHLFQRTWFLAGIAALAALILYAQSTHFGFVSLDDPLLISQNPLVTNGPTIPAIRGAFTTYDPELYIPLTILSYQLDFLRGGLEPGTYHTTNVLLHVLNILLVFAITFRLTGQKMIGFMCALLLAIHPLNVETVAWAAARKDLLSGFFALASIITYLIAVERENWKWFAASALLFAFGLLSKVTIILLPLFLFTLEWMNGSSWKTMIRRTGPSLILSLIFGIIAILGKTTNLISLSVIDYILLACKSTIFYFTKLIFPFGFSVLYPQTTPISITSAEFFVPVLIVIILTGFIIVMRRRLPMVWIASSLFFFFLAPAFLTVVKNGDIYVASDRYAYIASIGFFLMLGYAAHRLMSLYLFPERVKMYGVHGLIAAIACFLAFRSHEQLQVWRTNSSLFHHVLSLQPENVLALNNLGSELSDLGKKDEALTYFERAKKADPKNPLPVVNMGAIALSKGNQAEAEKMYREAISVIDTSRTVRPDDLLAYSLLGQLLDDQGKGEEAIKIYEEAAERGTAFPEPQFNLGLLYHKYNQKDEAIAQYQKAVALNHRHVRAHYNLAELLAEKGELAEALEHIEAVLSVDPDYQDAQQHAENLRGMVEE